MESKHPLLPAYALSAIAVVAAVLGSLVVMETATIKLVVPTSRLVANVTLNGGPSGRDLTTIRIQANVTDSQQGTASTVTIPPAYAGGEVVFTCSPCPSSATTIPGGITVSTAAGVHYAVLGPTDLSASHNPSAPVPIRALVQGKAGNTGANTITVIDNPIPNVKVTNPKPLTGATDGGTYQVIAQSDYDRVRLALTAKVIQDLDAALKAQAEGLQYLADGQPGITVTSDHKIDDQVPAFTITMTATLSATAFSQGKADSLMRSALDKKLPKGFQLTADPIQTNYQVQTPSANGDVTIKASATAVIVPSVTADQLKSRIKGMRVETARQQLLLLAPGTTVDISVKPAVPWLPVLQDHITLTIVLVSATG